MKLLAWISCIAFGLGSLHEATAISCQSLNSTLFGECVRLGYNVSTFMENSTQDAILDLIRNIHGTFKQCSSLSNFMACSVHVPRCTPGSNDKNASLPCMDVCKQFVAECKTSLRDYGLWRLFTGLCPLLSSDGSCLKPQNLSNSDRKTEPSNTTTCKFLAVPQCFDAGYNLTSISTDQQESVEKSSVFQGFNNKSFCPTLRKLVCMEMVPPCDNANRQSLYVPCKSLCEKAFQECPSQFTDIFKSSSYCSAFPDSKTKNDTRLCVLDAWPSSGLWPSNLWTSFAGAAGPTQSSSVNTTTSTPKSSVNSTSTLQPPVTKSENNTASATSAPITMNASVQTSSPNTTLATQQSGNKTTLATPTPITSLKSNRTSTASSLQNGTTTARPPSSSGPNMTTSAKPQGNGTTTSMPLSSSGPNITTTAKPHGNDTSTSRPPSSSGPNITTTAKPRENGTTTARPSSSSGPNSTTTPKPHENGTTTARPPSSTGPNITTTSKPKVNGTTTTRPPSSTGPNITTSSKPKGNGTTTAGPPSSTGPNITTITKPKGNGTTTGPMTMPKGNSTAKPSQNGTTTAMSTSAKSTPPASGQTNSSPTQSSTTNGKGTGTAVLSHQGGSISAEGISGIVLGVIALVMAIAVGILCFRRYHRNKSQFQHSIMVNMDEL